MASLQSSTTASGRWRRALRTVKAATSLRSTSKRASRTLENLDRSVETDIEQGNKGKFVSSRTKNAKLQRNLEKTGVHGGAFDHVVKMYQNCNDSEEGFKNSVVQWSAAYYVASALLITVALGLLYNCPEPRDTSKDVNMVHARIHSDTLDSVVGVLYLACASAASY